MNECPTCGCINTEQAEKCEKCASPLLGSDIRCGLYTYGGTSNGQVLQRRYIIVRELSSDFTGVRYLAEDAEENKNVIIWALPKVAADDEDKIQTLSELCDCLSKCTDEDILKISGVYSKDDARYFVVEQTDVLSLEERITSEGPLNIEEAIEIFTPVARSIDYAHKQGLIHGDLCPANILISPKGVIKLANFAIGRAVKEMFSGLLPEEKAELSFYTAPEQIENTTCSAQGDIYSLAACIYQSLCETTIRAQLQNPGQRPVRLNHLSERQNEVLLKSLSGNPQERYGSATELLAELRDEAADTVAAEAEQSGYEKSLAELRQKAQDWSRELGERIQKLITGAEEQKQRHAEILSRTQEQARQQAEQLRVDYEQRIEQLKTKIAETQGNLAAALGEIGRRAEALVEEKGKALQQSREHEKAIDKLISEAEWERQKHAEQLNRAQVQIREQAEQQLADYEEKIEQLKAKIADTELAAVATLGQTERSTEALDAEKEKALQQSKEHEEAIRKLIEETEQEKQRHLEMLSRTQMQVRQQAEHRLTEYEEKIKQLEARIAEIQAKPDAVTNEPNQKLDELSAENEKALEQSREHGETIRKLIADAEQEKQRHLEVLSQTETQVRQQSEQRLAEYEEKIRRLEDRITEIQSRPAAVRNEASQKVDELTAEKEKTLQQLREREETIKKLIAEAEQEKQQHLEVLKQAQIKAREQVEQQRADYEQRIEQLKTRMAETESTPAVAVDGANKKVEELASEKERALQQIREREETIRKLIEDAEQEKLRHLEILKENQTRAGELAEQQRADYEQRIEQLNLRIAELEEQLAAAVKEAQIKAEELAAEKERALQQIREREDTIKKLIEKAEQEKQQHLETLKQGQIKTGEQAKQQRADYEQRIEQLNLRIAEMEGKLAANVKEAELKAEELTAEKESTLQKCRENEEIIKKLTAEAEQEKQKSTELLRQVRSHARIEAEQQMADNEEIIKQLKTKIAETEAKLAAASSKTEVLAAEKEKILQQSKEQEKVLKDIETEVKKQQRRTSAEYLDQLEPQADKKRKIPTKVKTATKVFVWVLIAVLFAATGYIYVQQIENPFKQLIATKPPRKPAVYEPIAESGSSAEQQESQIQNGVQNDATEQTVSQPAAEIEEPQIKQNMQTENRPQMSPYFLCLSQATTAYQSGDLDKAVELYTRALTYYDNKDARRKLEEAREEQRRLSQMTKAGTEVRGWLESASDF